MNIRHLVSIAIMLLCTSTAQAQGILVTNLDDLPHVGTLPGTNACVIITQDSNFPESTTEICSKIIEISRWSVSTSAGHLDIEVDMNYHPQNNARITKVTYSVANTSWMAIISFQTYADTDGRLNPIHYTRGVRIDEFRLFGNATVYGP